MPEIEVIHDIACRLGKVARIAIRVNPNVDAHTHHYITTGIEENKFGVYLSDLDRVVNAVSEMPRIRLLGIHFHIGSQITDMSVFRGLCLRAREIQSRLHARGVVLPHINFGGGLGVDYEYPDEHPIPDFRAYSILFPLL